MAGVERKYVIAASVVVPLVVLALLALVLYLCCSRRYRLNWYEKTLLESGQGSAETSVAQSEAANKASGLHSGSLLNVRTEKSRINSLPVEPYASCKVTVQHVSFDDDGWTNGEGVSIASSARSCSLPCTGSEGISGLGGYSGRISPSGSGTVPHSQPQQQQTKKRLSISGGLTTTSCTPKYVLLTPDGDSIAGSANASPTASASSLASSMGAWNSTSIPSLDHEQGIIRRSSLQVHGMEDSSSSPREQFWVPPTVVQKKRAQSLIPHLGLMQTQEESEDGSSPSRTPVCKSSTSLQEMMFTYPPDKLTETVTPVQVPGGGQYQRRRRASMQDALDHTKINARLYSTESPTPEAQESIESVSEDSTLGSVNVSLIYNQEQALLTVRLIQARDLVARDFSGTADPYARLCLQPNRRVQLQSKVHRKTLCPEFEEEFIFEVTPAALNHSKLQILLLDYDQFSRDECIGEAVISLEHVDLTEKVVLWKGISPYDTEKREECADFGDLMFSLGYLSSAERLTVVVMKARNLKPAEDTRATPSPLVKVTLVSMSKRLKKKKTSTKRNTLNPTWNEALVFSLGKESLSNISIEFVVYSDNLLGNSEPVGRVVVGPNSAGEELAHWNDVMNSKNAMARWHHLASVDSPSTS